MLFNRGRSPYGFSVARYTYPARAKLGCEHERFVIGVYSFCLIYSHRLLVTPLQYSLPCRTYFRPVKINLFKRLFWWTGRGTAPRVQNTFLSASTLHCYLTIFVFRCQVFISIILPFFVPTPK
jgi:hypothetical protein